MLVWYIASSLSPVHWLAIFRFVACALSFKRHMRAFDQDIQVVHFSVTDIRVGRVIRY